MSYEIEYRYLAFAFDGQRAYQKISALAEKMGVAKQWWFPEFGSIRCCAVFCEHGSSNTVDSSGRLSRDWGLQHVGPVGEVMDRVIDMSHYVESGMTKPFGREQHAEAYIAATRKRIKAAVPLERLSHVFGCATAKLTLHVPNQVTFKDYPWIVQATQEGRITGTESYPVFECDMADQERLECDLLSISIVSGKTCATEASLERHGLLSSVLGLLAGSRQLELAA